MKELVVTSPSFGTNQKIPQKYTCDGDDINPELRIEQIPSEAKSFVLIVEDPDAPNGTFDHWIVFDIPIRNNIGENSIPGTEGLNSFGRHSYGGPCPPSGTHRYFFKVYALDAQLKLGSNTKKNDLHKAMQSHVLAEGELVGLYSSLRNPAELPPLPVDTRPKQGIF